MTMDKASEEDVMRTIEKMMRNQYITREENEK